MSFDNVRQIVATKSFALVAPVVVVFLGLIIIGTGTSTPPSIAAETPTADAATTAKSTETDAKPTQVATATKVDFSDKQRAEIEKIVRSYLLQNPEILREMTTSLQEKEALARNSRNKQIVVTNKVSLYQSKHDYVFGNRDGDVGIVEFFDYNCSWCKRALTEVQNLAAADSNVRVVMKEFPIFGPDSEFAARAAMAAVKQNKYWELHVALMGQERVTKDSVLTAAKSLGLDMARLQKDMEDPEISKALKETARVAAELDIQGTPAFIVDTNVNVGYVPVAGLKTMIADTRKQGCRAC